MSSSNVGSSDKISIIVLSAIVSLASIVLVTPICSNDDVVHAPITTNVKIIICKGVLIIEDTTFGLTGVGFIIS